jgi:hypothetical protein
MGSMIPCVESASALVGALKNALSIPAKVSPTGISERQTDGAPVDCWNSILSTFYISIVDAYRYVLHHYCVLNLYFKYSNTEYSSFLLKSCTTYWYYHPGGDLARCLPLFPNRNRHDTRSLLWKACAGELRKPLPL